jgi:hypothetical protein
MYFSSESLAFLSANRATSNSEILPCITAENTLEFFNPEIKPDFLLGFSLVACMMIDEDVGTTLLYILIFTTSSYGRLLHQNIRNQGCTFFCS